MLLPKISGNSFGGTVPYIYVYIYIYLGGGGWVIFSMHKPHSLYL